MSNYSDYLQSSHWKQIAEETKRLASYRCQLCNKNENLQAHHRTYERRGDELQLDLICLCGDCHALFHGKGGRNEEEKDIAMQAQGYPAPITINMKKLSKNLRDHVAKGKNFKDGNRPVTITFILIDGNPSIEFPNSDALVEWIIGTKKGILA